MYFRSWEQAAEYGAEMYRKCSVWYDEEMRMFYAIPV